MPVGGDWQDWNTWTSGATQNVTWTFTDSTSGYAPQPFVAVPVAPVAESVDDSPLAWLRSQVAEITDLARAA